MLLLIKYITFFFFFFCFGEEKRSQEVLDFYVLLTSSKNCACACASIYFSLQNSNNLAHVNFATITLWIYGICEMNP